MTPIRPEGRTIISRVSIRNWQSLRRVDLDLGQFTVVVGPSSSGKTGLLRALRAVASNTRGTAAITRGATSCAVTVHTGQQTITLERGDGTGQYRVTGPDGTEQTYTKLAGAVPDAVTRALRIDPVPAGGSSINFAFQFDRPYLLDDSGATVARVLGDLTNVSRIFAAVREANRRRAAHATTLKTREADLAAVIAQARTHAALPARLVACQRAEAAAEAAAALTDRVDRLRTLSQTLSVAQGILSRAPVLRDVLDDTAARQAVARLTTFRRVTAAQAAAYRAEALATQAITDSTAICTALEAQRHDTLLAAGTCPTCGQAVTGH